MRILVSGMVAADPYHGGATWAVLQYVLGLEQLGHDVWLVDAAAAREDAERYFSALDLGSQAFLGAYAGPLPDLLLDVSGTLRDERVLESTPIRVFLDLDPTFNQLWHIQGIDRHFDAYTHFVTVGRRVGRNDCEVPTCGVDWIPSFPPVVLEHWPAADGVEPDALTTVGNWRSYGTVEHEGVRYGQKAHSLRKLIDLPQRCEERFALALAIDPAENRDLETLAANGWELLDPRTVAGTPGAYQSFLQHSKAELGVAKEGYVVSRCGWFSDRSACYLASSRPVVAQDTGFGEFLPTGAGLFAFATQDDVLAALDEMNRDYGRHSRAARAIAEEFLDSERVLGELLRAVGAEPGPARTSVRDVDEHSLSMAIGRQVVGVRRRPSAYRSSAPIVELEVELGDHTTLTLLLKDLSRSSLTVRARRAKPDWLYDPMREIDVYRSVLATEDLRTPELYGAVTDAANDRYWLLIEKVAGVELYQVGELNVWEAVMRWLARFHDHFAGRRKPHSLLRVDRERLLGWRERARRIASVEVHDYEYFVDQLARMPTTILHGELYPSNILVRRDRVCPVDWEMASIGPGVIDVAAITTGWDEDTQLRLARAYLRELSEPPPETEFERHLDCARVHIALQWLGWAPDWEPPPEHAHDWHAELERAAARLAQRGEV